MCTAKEILERKQRERQSQPSWIVSRMKIGDSVLIECESNDHARRTAGTFLRAANRQNRIVTTTVDGSNLVVSRLRKRLR